MTDETTAGPAPAGPAMNAGGAPVKIGPQFMRELIDRYDDGETVKELGKAFGVHHSTVARQLRKHGCQLRPRGRRRKEA